MRSPSAAEFLAVWEQGLEKLPFERALALLEAACPEASREELAALTIGQRDGLLLSLRESAFGRRFTAVATCPHCDQSLEIEMDAALLRKGAGADSNFERTALPLTVTITVAAYEVQLRAPNSADLSASAGMGPGDASRHIFDRCVAVKQSNGEAVSAGQLPGEVASQVAEAISNLDPLADIQMEVQCASCARPWTEPFDIVYFLWNEIDAWARRMLREVHGLATAYGWTEPQVLALSPMRRHYYLEMAGA